MMSTLAQLHSQIAALLHSPLVFGDERVPEGRAEYQRLAPDAQGGVESFQSLGQLDKRQNSAYCEKLLHLASLECAAGAGAARCRAWFGTIAQVASLPLGAAPAAPAEAALYFALADDFDSARYADWPEEIDTQATASRVIYRLMSGKPLEIEAQPLIGDGQLWLRGYRAAQQRSRPEAQATCAALANWWLHDYEATETPRYNLERYPCFEPDCNALCAILMRRERLPLRFAHKHHRDFYMAALLGAD